MNVHDKTIKRTELTTGPLTGSRKVYSAPDGHDDVPVPFREIALGNGENFRCLRHVRALCRCRSYDRRDARAARAA